ncbi:MAG: helix-turn-helix domain-containing protein [Coprococcus sp.]
MRGRERDILKNSFLRKLGISDKTISKWERGNGFPEVSLLLPLCDELEITVNELLSGERVSEEDYRKKAEVNMVNLVREAQESKRKLFCLQWSRHLR